MLTVCDLSRLNRATLEPEGIHTVGGMHEGGKGVKKEKCNGHNIHLDLIIPRLQLPTVTHALAPTCHSYSSSELSLTL